MELGIIGLPKSGKTTVFNALTRSQAETAAYAAGGAPNIGVVKVPDPRLQALAAIFKPKRLVPAEVKYIDVAGAAAGFGKSEGIAGQFLTELSKVDALIHVVRAFPGENVPHIEGSIDPDRDIATVNLELAFSDMAIIEKRLQRLQDSLKSGKASDREAALWEQRLLARIKDGLEKEKPIREQTLEADEAKAVENYQFLTAKPLFLLINIGEAQLAEAPSIEEAARRRHERPLCRVGVLCGKIEEDLAQMDEKEAAEFRAALGLSGESSLDRMIRGSYELLGLITFLTVGPDENRAWAIREGTTALKAAGKIHSDLEKGFIRAEVVSYEDMMKCGSMAEARKRGLLRLEGKTYEVKDGDVITILFNV
ncbi:MAG: redox-regulated ATPase YchF [Chloroflexi bacterium]|nr:redox-regulated ATPase YchF [Chloroflexota bacterium]